MVLPPTALTVVVDVRLEGVVSDNKGTKEMKLCFVASNLHEEQKNSISSPCMAYDIPFHTFRDVL